jgi:UDP-N-acetyl-D-mannosaminuronic acid dehydrogenase
MLTSEPSTVCILGLGYIGLPTAALMASRGWKVFGVDINADIVKTVASGRAHIAEPDLDGLVQKMVSEKRLVPSTRPEPANVFMITVPTPITDSYAPDLSYVDAAARSIAPHLQTGNLVVIESTCPVGTTSRICELLADLRPDLSFPARSGSAADVKMAYCPERLLPGRILGELQQNDRSIGGLSPACTEHAIAFYKTFVRGACIGTTAPTAELVKLAENAFRDVNIAFANELSLVSERLNVSVWDVIALANRHPRVKILQPGPGVGGHCIAVDPWFIVHSAPDIARLTRTARQVNDAKPEYIYQKATALLKSNAEQGIACLGLTFKANVDDLRESPALEVAEMLAKDFGARVVAVEPNIHDLPKHLQSLGVRLVSFREAIASCNILLLLVDHDQFRQVSASDLKGKTVIDTRGVWRNFMNPVQ